MPVPLAIAGAAVNIGKTISGAVNLKKDKAELSRLTPAFYKIQDEYYGNRDSAAELAQGGLPQATKDYYTSESARGLGSGISAINSSGGNPNDIARIFDSYNRGIRKIGADDAEAQIGNIKYFHQVNKDLAAQKTIQWGVNEYQPHQNELKELTQRIAADKQNIWSGIQGAIGSAQAGVTGMQNNKLLQSLYSNGKGGISDPVEKVDLFTIPGNDNVDENYNRPSVFMADQPRQQPQQAQQLNQIMAILQQMNQGPTANGASQTMPGGNEINYPNQ